MTGHCQPSLVHGWMKSNLVGLTYCIFSVVESLTICSSVTISNKWLTNFKYLFWTMEYVTTIFIYTLCKLSQLYQKILDHPLNSCCVRYQKSQVTTQRMFVDMILWCSYACNYENYKNILMQKFGAIRFLAQIILATSQTIYKYLPYVLTYLMYRIQC